MMRPNCRDFTPRTAAGTGANSAGRAPSFTAATSAPAPGLAWQAPPRTPRTPLAAPWSAAAWGQPPLPSSGTTQSRGPGTIGDGLRSGAQPPTASVPMMLIIPPAARRADCRKESDRWAFAFDEVIHKRAQQHQAALAEAHRRAEKGEALAAALQAQAAVMQQQLQAALELKDQEEAHADAAWARVAVLEGIIKTSAAAAAAAAAPAPAPVLQQWGEEKAMSEIGSSFASETTTEEHRVDYEHEHHVVEQQLLELRDRCVLAALNLADYRRLVQSSQDGLLLLQASGTDDLPAKDVGPVVTFANVKAAGVLKAEEGRVMHSPLLSFMQLSDWAAVVDAFVQALNASPISVTQSPPPLPRRLPVRLLDGETLVAAFMPTDEPGTVMCTLSRRGAAPLQG